MADAIDKATVEGFQGYVRDYLDKILTEMHYGSETTKIISALDGLKGEKIITHIVFQRVLKRYKKAWAGVKVGEFKPRTLKTYVAGFSLEEYPQDYENSYLGKARQKGQNPADLPYQAQIINGVVENIAQDIEDAVWNAVQTDTPTDDDYVDQVFDGFVEILKDEAAAGNITPFVSGSITNTNAVDVVESMYVQLHKAMKAKEIDCFVPLTMKSKYLQDYRERYGKHWGPNNEVAFDLGMLKFHFLPGVPEDFILITPKENLYYGTDSFGDASKINFEGEDRKLKMWGDIRIGVQFGIVSDKIMVVNDAALV